TGRPAGRPYIDCACGFMCEISENDVVAGCAGRIGIMRRGTEPANWDIPEKFDYRAEGDFAWTLPYLSH
ncbi:hypothetical protein, partial [Desulfococcus multivorans]|uniref:hypothetical protein n=1 Tax=Desulfococcus multivorans TaxID=897 RepID=UPI001F28651B